MTQFLFVRGWTGACSYLLGGDSYAPFVLLRICCVLFGFTSYLPS